MGVGVAGWGVGDTEYTVGVGVGMRVGVRVKVRKRGRMGSELQPEIMFISLRSGSS